MADTPKPTALHAVAVDMRDPLNAGPALALGLLLPPLKHVIEHLDESQKVLLWMSTLCALSGAMAGSIGHEAAIDVLQTLLKELPLAEAERRKEQH